MKVFYDNDCGLCTRSMSWLSDRSSGVSFHPLETASSSVVVELDDGTTLRSARAVAALLRTCGGAWGIVATAMLWPGVRSVSELCYRIVAANRSRISRRFGWTSCAVPASSRASSPSGREA